MNVIDVAFSEDIVLDEEAFDKAIEDFSSLLIPLNLIVKKNAETFCFSSKSADNIEPKLILFALSIIRGEDKTISFDKLQELAIIFCISIRHL